jgi:hypothetical protein
MILLSQPTLLIISVVLAFDEITDGTLTKEAKNKPTLVSAKLLF